MRLQPHPRLYIGTREIERLKQIPDSDLLRLASGRVAEHARRYREDRRITVDQKGHNWHLIRARQLQGRVFTLLIEWLRTGDECNRAAALDYLRDMAAWEYWSWIEWRGGQAIFDLSYGENSTTLAVAYDLLFDSLDAPEQRMLLDQARIRVWPRFHSQDGCAGRPLGWWWRGYDCNWLTVCAGGAGMLALAMYEEIGEGRAYLPQIDRAVMKYMNTIDRFGGGWPEGVGYWNYGMCYGFRYLVSHENATGKRHPAFKLAGTRATVRFPLDFSPCNKGTGFGDIVRPFTPMAFHYAVAERVGDHELLPMLDRLLAEHSFKSMGIGADEAEYLVSRPRPVMAKPRRAATHSAAPVVKIYPELNWGILADRMPEPRLYMSVRGGSTEVPHAHLDLFSYHCVSEGVHFIPNLTNMTYIDTTFDARRYETFDKGWASKNTLLVGGLGIAAPAQVSLEPVKARNVTGFRLQGVDAIRFNGYRKEAVTRTGRLMLMLDRRAWLVIDRFDLEAPNQFESRFFTFAEVRKKKDALVLRQEGKALAVSFAADRPGCMAFSQSAPVMPRDPVATMVRWCNAGLERSFTSATLLVPGAVPGRVTVCAQDRSRIAITASFARRTFRLVVNNRLGICRP